MTTAASTQDGEFFDDGIEITAPADLASAIVMREASFTPPLTRDDRDAHAYHLYVVRIDAEQNLLLVKGAVPGGKNALLTIRMA